MDRSDAPSPLNNDSFTKMKERTSLNQVMPFKASTMQRLIQMLQRMALKSCQLFCCPVDTVLCERAACCPAQDHKPTEGMSTQVALTSPPSTILILNISNSTLIDCVIGNDTYASAVAESQRLMQESALHMQDQMECSYSHVQQEAAQMTPPLPLPPVCSPLPSQELPRINIHGSHLNYVIIGDNNYMHAEHLTETEEPQM